MRLDRRGNLGDKHAMALLTPMDQTSASQLGKCFGLEVREVRAMVAGSVNSNFELTTASGDRYFARLYEEQDSSGALNEARLLRALTTFGVPTAAPLPPLAGEAAIPVHAGKPVAIYPWVGGTDLCLLGVTPRHCERLGRALAQVHSASSRLKEVAEGRFDVAGLRQRLAAARSAAAPVAADARRIEELLSQTVAARDAELPVGLIHGDLFRDNVLWEADELVALLDFESACRGVFLYDLMVCVLAWCYVDHFELQRVRALVAGYEAIRPLSSRERAAAVVEGSMACLRFATTRITDFEMRTPPGETPKRDYRRFLKRLTDLQAGALDSVFGASTRKGDS